MITLTNKQTKALLNKKMFFSKCLLYPNFSQPIQIRKLETHITQIFLLIRHFPTNYLRYIF